MLITFKSLIFANTVYFRIISVAHAAVKIRTAPRASRYGIYFMAGWPRLKKEKDRLEWVVEHMEAEIYCP